MTNLYKIICDTYIYRHIYMNLEILTDPLPKPFLNIACNSLTCNSLTIPPSQNKSCSYTNSNTVPLGATLTNGFDLAIIPNANFNTATSEYTCTESGLYKVSVSLGVACALAGTYDGRILITINGLPSQIGSGALICTVPVNCNNTVSCNQLLQLTPGDVIGFIYAWAGSMPSFASAQSGCFIVEKL